MTQTEALTVLKMGHNVFLTGAAGAGKTFVLNQFIDHLKANHINAGVTASTGIAATHIGGMTIHSWAGIGIKDELAKKDLQRIADNAQTSARIKQAKVLIIDEVSMLHGIRLDLVDQVVKFVRDNDKPYGGLQVVLCGDLFQLPPITRGQQPVDFIYTSQSWQEMNLKICYLHEQHRQDGGRLLELLNAIRDDVVDESLEEAIQERFVTGDIEQKITRLYTHNTDVERLNQEELDQIEGESTVHEMDMVGSKRLTETMAQSCLAPVQLELKIGAEVMFVANNYNEGFVNGTRGQVIDFMNDTNEPIVKIHGARAPLVVKRHTWTMHDGDKVRAELKQYPLRLAWAITIHKSQGMSMDAAEIDLSRCFEPGMGYVALSRVRSLEGLHLRGINRMALQLHPDIRTLDQQLRRQSVQVVAGLGQLDDDTVQKNHDQVVAALGVKKTDTGDLVHDEQLFGKLRSWRTKKAIAESMPAYIIFADKTLQQIAAEMPKERSGLSAISGIGPAKLESYGDDVMKIVEEHLKNSLKIEKDPDEK